MPKIIAVEIKRYEQPLRKVFSMSNLRGLVPEAVHDYKLFSSEVTVILTNQQRLFLKLTR